MIFNIAPFHNGHHALLGRTTFAHFNAVPHYAYLKLKMPKPRGVITVNGNTERFFRTEEHTTALAAEYEGSKCQPAIKAREVNKRAWALSPAKGPPCVRRTKECAPHGLPTTQAHHVPRHHNFTLKVPWASMGFITKSSVQPHFGIMHLRTKNKYHLGPIRHQAPPIQ